MKGAFLVLVLLSVQGCDFSEMSSPAPSAACRSIGERCRTADGPLGVCLETRCKDDQTPPCFACTPQH